MLFKSTFVQNSIYLSQILGHFNPPSSNFVLIASQINLNLRSKIKYFSEGGEINFLQI